MASAAFFIFLFLSLIINLESVNACVHENDVCVEGSPTDDCCLGEQIECVGSADPFEPEKCQRTCRALGGGARCIIAGSCPNPDDVEITDIDCGAGICCQPQPDDDDDIPAPEDCADQPGYEREGPNGICYPKASVINLPDKPVVSALVSVIKWILGFLAALAVLVIIIAGIQYIISAGDEKMVETAKRNIKWAVIGLAIALSSLAIVKLIDMMLRL